MRNFSSCWWCAAVALVLLACGGGEAPSGERGGGQAPSAETGGPAGTARIVGTIRYLGGDPDSAIDMSADPVCAGLHSEQVQTETVVSREGGLGNVFVWIKAGLEEASYPVPADPVVLDQNGCHYLPHVAGIMVGQKLIVRNSDPTLHNVHALPSENREFNQGQPFQGMELEKTFSQPEVMIRFKCDIHPWMAAYLGVVAHPYFAVTSPEGRFTIEGLPAGDYVLAAWHETLGSKTAQVRLDDGGKSEVTLEFAGAG